MNILVVGGGGREHAIASTLAQSAHQPTLFIAPGNAGTAELGINIPLAANDIDALVKAVREHSVDLVVVGPEQPLVLGLVDRLREAGIRVVGPTAAAAQLEGSKAFSKAFMARHGIPTAAYQTFAGDQYDAARTYLHTTGAPVVVKASGLAAGKGAVVCMTMEDAEAALRAMMLDRQFGAAADEVVIEAFMTGEEASVFALTDGSDYVLLATAQDHKRIGEGDTGPNTGGMGAYAPAPIMSEALMAQVAAEIIEPTLAGMRAEEMPYTGFLYVGLMITPDGPKVVEYNCRLGDPETQVVLPLLASDFVEVCLAAANGTLADVVLSQRDGASACVVLASAGYPGSYEKGYPIEGLDAAGRLPGVAIFQAGTQAEGDRIVTAGGRVLAVQAHGSDLEEALARAYAGVDALQFEGKTYRRDIGQKGLARLAT